MNFVETKLHPPALVESQVARPTLVDQVVSAPVKLVLVRAPAGFGKTTVMAQAQQRAEAAGTACGWITLDESDNDLSRFVSCLVETASRLGAESPHGATPFDGISALAALETPFVLFLDDFEVVREPGVLGIVRDLVEHLPRHGKVVLGSRHQPEIGLGRLRARGELLEIDTERLRFDFEDTRSFFGRRGQRGLGVDLLAQLHKRTEGWAAALWLASMALERSGSDTGFVEQFSGSDQTVAEFLAEDVLARQPPHLRDFLLRTSVLRHLELSICQTLCPRLDCAAILDELETANLFLTPVTGSRSPERAWRYHSLFAEFLRNQLQREQPDLVPRLHLVASGWYESQDRPVPAIDHAIDGGDFPLALDLLEGHAERFLEQGRMRLLARWFGVIPEDLVREHPMLQLISAWASCFTHGPWLAMQQLERSGCIDSPLEQIHLGARMLQPLLLAMQDRYEEAYEAGSAVLSAPYGTGMAFAQAALLNAMAGVLSVIGDVRESRRLIETARQQQNNKSNFNRMYSESLEGIHDLHEGRLRQATARFRISVDSTHVVVYNHTHGNAWAGVLYADALYEANQLDRAEHLVNVYLPIARDVGFADHLVLSHLMRTRIMFIAGDVDSAFRCLDELEYLGFNRQLPRVVAAARLERSRLLLMQGNAARSRDELNAANDLTIWARERRQRLVAHDIDYHELARIRWELHFGDPHGALSLLTPEIAAAARSSRNRRLLKLRLLRALALQRTGEVSAATQEIGQVLQTACHEGYVRLILDEGPVLGTLIERYHQGTQPDGATSLNDPILTEYLARLLESIGPGPEPARPPAETPVLDEPLTPKEIRILELLAEGYSNSAMSEKMFISDSTVRTHLRNINTKMGTKSRTQALAMARRMGLIR
jgi:LuxR family maltose regulon positive regulatory protein